MHAHVRYSRVLHYRQGPKLRGRTYTFVHVTYLDVLYLVPARTRSRSRVRTRLGSVRAHLRGHRFECRARPKFAELGRTPRSRLSRSSPDATSSQYRVSPPAELVSDLCQSRASRHSPFLPAGFPSPFNAISSGARRNTKRCFHVISSYLSPRLADASPFRTPATYTRLPTYTYRVRDIYTRIYIHAHSTYTVIQCHSGVTSGENKN